MLTRKQYDLLILIDGYLKEEGFSPSFDEMKEGLRLRSKSGIHRLITALEERGFLARLHNRARALEVLRLPENLALANIAPHALTTLFAGVSNHRESIVVRSRGTSAHMAPR